MSRKVYQSGAFSAYVTDFDNSNEKAMKAYVSFTDSETGESRIMQSFFEDNAEAEAVALVDSLEAERIARLHSRRHRIADLFKSFFEI